MGYTEHHKATISEVQALAAANGQEYDAESKYWQVRAWALKDRANTGWLSAPNWREATIAVCGETRMTGGRVLHTFALHGQALRRPDSGMVMVGCHEGEGWNVSVMAHGHLAVTQPESLALAREYWRRFAHVDLLYRRVYEGLRNEN